MLFAVLYRFSILFSVCFPALAAAAPYPQGNTLVWTPPSVTLALSPSAGTYPYNAVRDIAVAQGRIYVVALPLYDAAGVTGHAQLIEFDQKGTIQHRDTIPHISWANWADARVATDAYGNVFVAGEGGSLQSYLVKYGIGMVKTWTISVSAQDIGANLTRSSAIREVAVKDVAADSNGNVYVVGNTYGNAITDRGVFIIKYNPDGVKQWSEESVTSTFLTHQAGGVTTDGLGNVYFAGTFDGSPYLIKYGFTNGVTNGAKEWSNPTSKLFESVTTDRKGNVYAVGNGNLSKYDALGNLAWGISDSGTTRFYSSSFSLAVESDGSIYVANAGGLSKYKTSNGTEVWRYDSFTVDGSVVMAVAADSMSVAPNIYFGGAVGVNHGDKLSLTRLSGTDTDGDRLYDIWETEGYTDNVNGVAVFVDLPAMGADPLHKDLFVHADWMNPASTYKPSNRAIKIVADAFENSPVPNPDGTTGIHLHVDSGPTSIMNPVTGQLWGTLSSAGEVPFQATIGSFIGSDYDWTAVDQVKQTFFNPSNRNVAFHYALFGHDYDPVDHSSGISRGIPGSDFLVTLGGWHTPGGTTLQTAGTFFHEFGHNLGLQHGGNDEINNKPNYLSIMNYSFQVVGLIMSNGRPEFNYSVNKLPTLNEASLSEGVGIADPDNHFTLWNIDPGPNSCTATPNNYYKKLVAPALDWDCTGALTPGTVSVDISGDGSSGNLPGFADWPAIVFDGGGRISGTNAAGSEQTTTVSNEPTLQQIMDKVPAALFNAELTAPVDVVTLSPQQGPAPLTVSFDGSASTAPVGNVTSWAWDFGDGSSGIGVTVKHTYSTPGTYFVALTVTDNHGTTNRVPLRHRVTVTASLPLVTVPNVVGMTQATAQTATTTATLTVGVITQASSATVLSGSVISQKPLAGVSVAPGTAVDLVVSTGPVMLNVPDVVGQTQSAAQIAITGAGLTVGTVTTASSLTVPAGNVISQNPLAGSLLAQGSPVSLVISSPGPLLIGSTYYQSLQFTYDHALTGAVIKAQATILSGDLTLNRGIPVTLKGGYDIVYANQIGMTVIGGKLIVGTGSMVVDRVVIR
jgi:PKD repeat protein